MMTKFKIKEVVTDSMTTRLEVWAKEGPWWAREWVLKGYHSSDASAMAHVRSLTKYPKHIGTRTFNKWGEETTDRTT